MELQLAMPKAVFFDWDGTLADSFTFLHEGHNHVLKALGLGPIAGEEYRRHFGRPRDEVYLDLYGDRQEEAKLLFEDFVTTNHAILLRPAEGAGALLQTLRDMAIPAAVVSNKKPDFIRMEIESFGWRPFIHTAIGAGEAEEDKPSAHPLKLAADRVGLQEYMGDIWYVGDTEIDLMAARNAGARAIYIHKDAKTHDWVARYNPAMIVENCMALHDFLLQCRQN